MSDTQTRCRTCGFTHEETDCPRWPAREATPEAHTLAAALHTDDRDAAHHAKYLAAKMTQWLNPPTLPHDVGLMDNVPSDVVEWCRSARDLLEMMGAEA